MSRNVCILAVVVYLSLLELVNSKSLRPIEETKELRIIGGNEVVPHSVPSVVSLVIANFSYTHQTYDSLRCGGTLISHKYVLTAASCTYLADDIYALISVHNLMHPDVGNLCVKASRWIHHRKYNLLTREHDIGLVELAGPVSYIPGRILPAPLPRWSDVSKTYTGEQVSAYGWGRTVDNRPSSNVLRGVRVPVISLQQCRNEGRRFGLSIPDGSICTSTSNGKFGTCRGDWGGPLFASNGVQIGITSFSSNPCNSGAPDVFVRVTDYLKWIQDESDVIIQS